MLDSPSAASRNDNSMAFLFQSDHRYKYLDSFITLFVVILIISNIVAPKLVVIGPLEISAAQMLFPITYIFGDIFTEVYGYGASRRAIWFGFFASALYVLVTYLCIKVPGAPDYKDQTALETILGSAGRVVAGSLVAFWCGEFANSFTLAKLKLLTKGKYLWTRTVGSTVVGQAVDTSIVILFIFGGRKPPMELLHLILSGYAIKVFYETVMTPFTYTVVNFLKRVENVDYFDYKTNFSPFSTKN